MSLFLGDQSSEDAKRIARDLRADIAQIPLKSFSVKKVFKEVREAWEDDFWRYLTQDKIQFLRLKVSPLLRYVPGINPIEAFFVSKMERCGLSFLQHKELKQHIESIREDVSLLPSTIKDVEAQQKLINDVLSNEFWFNIALKKIDDARERLTPLMKYRRERPSLVIELGLDDIIDSRKWVVLRKDFQKLYVEEYRKKVEEKIEQVVKKHPTIQRLKSGESVDVADLIKLEETLENELSTEEISLDEENMLKAFGIRAGSFVDFLKHVLDIETLPTYETIVRKAFDAFILEHNYNADQSRFLHAVQNVFIHRRKLELADLYEEPFTNFGTNAVEKLFSNKDINELIELTNKLTA